MKTIHDSLLMIAGGLLLLAANGLAFHDIRETHTVRDYLMLIGSILVFIKFARDVWRQRGPASLKE